MKKKRQYATKETVRECPFCHIVMKRHSRTCPHCKTVAPYPSKLDELLQNMDDDEFEKHLKSLAQEPRLKKHERLG